MTGSDQIDGCAIGTLIEMNELFGTELLGSCGMPAVQPTGGVDPVLPDSQPLLSAYQLKILTDIGG